MRNRNLLYLGVTALLLLLGLAGSLWVMRPLESSQVEIIQDSITICRLDLSREKDRTIAVTYNGNTNLIEIQDHQIRVLEAECLDHDCVEMGWLQSDGLPIVCLPNHLVIQFVQPSGDVDALA